MSNIKKFIEIMSETTSSGAIATGGFAPYDKKVGETIKRTAETVDEKISDIPVIEYGNWENSALTTSNKMTEKRAHKPKLVKSIYGEDTVSKDAVKEQKNTKELSVNLTEADYPFNPSDPKNWAKKLAYDNRMKAKAEREANKPAAMPKAPSAPKLTLDDVWRKIEDVVGRIFPDGDPIDYLAPWLEKHGIRDFKIGEILDRAAKKNGYKDLYDYYNSMKDQYARDNVAEGLVGNVVVHNYTKTPIDLKPGQAQIHGWGPGEQIIYRVKGHDGKEVITSNKKKMMMIAQKQGVAEAGYQSPHAKLAQLKAKYDAALKSPNPNPTTLRRIRDQIIKLEFDLGIKEGVAEGSDENFGVGSGAISSSIPLNKNGKTIGELFQTREGSWGYFVYANAKSQEGFGSKEEALAAMKQAIGQGVAEGGILKSIKRGMQGWDKNAVGPGGEKLGDPRDIVKRAKAMDIDTAKKVRAGLDAAQPHSPAGLQKRVLDRRLKDVAEEQLQEEDLVIVPGQGLSRRTGFVPHGKSRVDHEVSMAKSDLYQASKNAIQIFSMLKNISEEEGLEGWVQEKIIKAADYLNTVREYLEGKHYVGTESMDGVAPSTRMFTSEDGDVEEGKTGPGLWANIRARKASGKRMRKPGEEGAPSEKALKAARAGSKNESTESVKMKCPECGGDAYDNPMLAEKKDACYHKVKSRYKVWPSAYASGALVKCRKQGAKNWGTKTEDINEDEKSKLIASVGDVEVFSQSSSSEGSLISVRKAGKEIATGDFDRWANVYFIQMPETKSDKSFDSGKEIAEFFANVTK